MPGTYRRSYGYHAKLKTLGVNLCQLKLMEEKNMKVIYWRKKRREDE